jgi:hypothetical protein
VNWLTDNAACYIMVYMDIGTELDRRLHPMAPQLDQLWQCVTRVMNPHNRNDLRQLVRNLDRCYDSAVRLAVECRRRHCLTSEFLSECERFDQLAQRVREYHTLALLSE